MKKITWLLIFCTVLFISCENNSDKAKKTTSQDNTIGEKTQTKESENIEEPILTVDEKIVSIKTSFKQIQSIVAQPKEKSIETEEGTVSLKAYYDKESIVQIEREFAIGHHTVVSWFYIKDDVLFFVHRFVHGEESLHGPYTTEEKRIYLWDNKIIRCLKKNIKITGNEEVADPDAIPNVDITAEAVKDDSFLAEVLQEYRDAKKAFDN